MLVLVVTSREGVEWQFIVWKAELKSSVNSTISWSPCLLDFSAFERTLNLQIRAVIWKGQLVESSETPEADTWGLGMG